MAKNVFKTLQAQTSTELENNLLETKKELFMLRLKQATRQPIKPHLFGVYRQKIAQILTLLSQRTKTI